MQNPFPIIDFSYWYAPVYAAVDYANLTIRFANHNQVNHYTLAEAYVVKNPHPMLEAAISTLIGQAHQRHDH